MATDRRFVVNASPLILLAHADVLWLLRELSAEVLVPATVKAEVLAGGKQQPEIHAVAQLEWLQTVADLAVPADVAAWELGAGESQVLAHAVGRPDRVAILDDRQARRCAETLSVSRIGTLGLVLRARRLEIIPAARPVVMRLLAEGMYLDPRMVEAALAEVGE